MKSLDFKFLLILGILIGLGYAQLIQHKNLRLYENRIEKLEVIEKRSRKENAWVIEAIESIFAIGFNNYKRRITEAEESYLTPNGIRAYRNFLAKRKMLEILDTSEAVYTVKVEGAPLAKSIKEFDTTLIDGAYKIRYTTIYRLKIYAALQSGSKTHGENFELDVSVGDLYGKGYVITDIKEVSE